MGVTAIAEGLTLDGTALGELQAAFRGEIVGRDDVAYDEQRKVWNGSIDRRPALIARCAGVADVIASLKLCRRHGLPVAVRSGGHSFPGLSVADDAFLIDLSLMKGVRVDPDARTARVQAGVLLGELDRETQAFGLAAPAGIVTTTGVAGLTLGGGIGWVMRKHGLAIDNLRRVDVVTADGELVRASADENVDLFWGVRGGGGNFGIVTEFEFDLVPVGPSVIAGPIFWSMEDSPDVLRFYRDWVADAPDELMTILLHRKAPPLPFVPEELHGNAVVDICEEKPFVAHQAMFDPSFPPGRWYYFKSCDVPALTDEIIDTTVEHSLQISSPLTSFPIWQTGGAVARVGEDETAFNGRSAGFTYNIGASTATAEGFDEEREWVRNLWSALERHFTGVYVNFLMDEGEDRVRQAYGAEKYARLKTLKRKYDPENVFRINQNIPPA